MGGDNHALEEVETGDNLITSIHGVNLFLWLGLGSLTLRPGENGGREGGMGRAGGPIDWKLFIGKILLLRKIGKIGQKIIIKSR